MKKFKLDKINLEILKSLEEENKVNFSKLGKKLGLSHVAIKNRFESLIDNNFIKTSISVNFSKLGYKLGLILMEVETSALEHLFKIYQNCPRVIYYFEIMGQYNLALLFFGENEKTFETILKSCMLYSLEGVHKSNILIFAYSPEDLFLPLNFALLNQENDNTPCGTCCKNCGAFKENRCVGCPASQFYKGTLKVTD